MLIRLIAASRSVEIEDPGNFREFAVRIEGAFEEPAARDVLLGSLAVSHDREHAWISEAALRAWAPLKEEAWWQEGLSGMIAAAQRFGWVDNDNHTIRAHIEYVP